MIEHELAVDAACRRIEARSMSEPNADNAATRLIAVFVICLLICAILSICAGFVMMTSSNSTGNYSTGAGLCFLAAAIALGSGLFAMVKLVKK